MRLRNLGLGLLLALMTGILFVAARAASWALPVQDLAQYWAGAHLLTQNPYSLDLVTNFERSSGVFTSGTPMVMRNPPWSLVLVLPLKFFSYHTAFALWDLLSVILVAGCARAAWHISNPKPSLAPALLSLLFGPTVVLLMLGQIAVLVLLGVTLFLIMVERRRDWIAGASLLLVCTKPHIAFLFLLAVALWTIRSKRWAVLISGAVMLAAASIIVVAMNPRIFAQYLDSATQFVHETRTYPNLGGILYLASGRHNLAFVPQLLGVIWLLWYWWRNRSAWDWKEQGLVVLLVSLVCSYYSFPFDEIVAIPALMAGFARGNRLIFLAGFALTNLGYAIYISNVAQSYQLTYMFLSWTASAWLITYLLSRAFSHPVRS